MRIKYQESFQSLKPPGRTHLRPPTTRTCPACSGRPARLVEQHSRAGYRYYREEKLKEAIASGASYEMDAGNANARRNIDEAGSCWWARAAHERSVHRQSGDRHHESTRRTRTTLLPIISLTLLLAGCPEPPMVPVVAAPAGAGATAAPPPPPAPAPAPAPVAPPSSYRLLLHAPSAGAAEGVPATRGSSAPSLAAARQNLTRRPGGAFRLKQRREP